MTLEKDTKKREVVIPAYIKSSLKDADLLEQFLQQPDYIKREHINHIQIAKKEETKINRLNALIKRLGE